jgi:hypothetical protein
MVALAEDLRLALDRAAFARSLGLEPDPWQENLLHTRSDRVLLNCCRQSGKSTMSGLIPFHTGKLKIAEGMELWPALKKELLNFRRKIDLRTAHDSYEHWRESDHDDLVLAAALACWWITYWRGRTRMRVIR